MQPYLFPYIGYFQLINIADKFVLYDDVNYIKKGWINRNNLMVNGKKMLFTVSLAHASQNKLINEIEIADTFEKLLKTIQINYSKAEYYKQTNELINKIISYKQNNLRDFIKNSLEALTNYIGIESEMLVSSELNKNNALKGQDKILEICKLLNASSYFNLPGGMDLYDKNKFREAGIELYFVKTNHTPYKQFSKEFEPALSIIDVLMHNSIERVNELLNKYELVKKIAKVK